jgi:hypothetical protein
MTSYLCLGLDDPPDEEPAEAPLGTGSEQRSA